MGVKMHMGVELEAVMAEMERTVVVVTEVALVQGRTSPYTYSLPGSCNRVLGVNLVLNLEEEGVAFC